MDFLSATLLWGCAAAGVPVLLHLLGRAKPVVHRFPAMRFILRSQRTSSRALKLKHLLVLLLRIMVLALIALLLARPCASGLLPAAVWYFAALITLALAGVALYRREFMLAALSLATMVALYENYPRREAGTHGRLAGDYLLIIDRSMSMAYQETGGTRLDLARQQALALLERLSPQSRVALLLAADSLQRVPGRLSLQHELVRENLLRAVPSGTALNLAAALQAAREILARDGPASIVLFTDLQATSLQALLEKGVTTAEANAAPLLVVDVASEEARNGAALACKLPARVLPADALLSASAKIRPPERERPCLVELYLDDKRISQKLLPPSPLEVAELEFQFNTGAPGAHVLRLSVGDSDRLPLDQSAYAAYSAGRPAKALILESPPAAGKKRGSAFFLKAALQAPAPEAGLSSSGLDYDILPAFELTQEKLAAYKIVILADCGTLGQASWSRLQQWCAEGGGLFVFVGPCSDLQSLRPHGFQLHARHQGLLPGNIKALVAPEQPLPITLTQPEHPALIHFNPELVTLLRQTEVRRFVKIVAQPEDALATTVLTLGDGSPLLLDKSYGRGRVLLCAIDPGAEFSDLPRRAEAYVTLLLDCVRLLSEQDDEVEGRLGAALILSLATPPTDNQVFWRPPDAKDGRMLKVDLDEGSPRLSGKRASVVVPPLEKTGVHSFTWTSPTRTVGSPTSAPMTRLIAVNADPSESDIKKASPQTAQQAFGGFQTTLAKSLGEAGAFQGLAEAESARHELAPILLLALIVLLFTENFLSNRLYRSVEEPEQAAALTASRPEEHRGAS